MQADALFSSCWAGIQSREYESCRASQSVINTYCNMFGLLMLYSPSSPSAIVTTGLSNGHRHQPCLGKGRTISGTGQLQLVRQQLKLRGQAILGQPGRMRIRLSLFSSGRSRFVGGIEACDEDPILLKGAVVLAITYARAF